MVDNVEKKKEDCKYESKRVSEEKIEEMSKELEYRGASLSHESGKLEKIYNVSFLEGEKYDNVLFTGQITTSNLSEALDSISTACNVKFHRQGKTIKIVP